jgi:hypothetical protein
VPRYRLHFTHPDGVTTTDDHTSDDTLAVGDVVEVAGKQWRVEEVEPFQLEDYAGLVAVVPADADERGG